jgi:hypothetical protein
MCLPEVIEKLRKKYLISVLEIENTPTLLVADFTFFDRKSPESTGRRLMK